MILVPLLLDPPHARAALRTEVARAAPGRPFLAAVEIDTDPHWHVYWRNPGDSGIPTTVAWSAPKGWRVEPLEYPAPRRFAPGGVAAYGYEGKTLLLARITPSAMPGVLSARVKWLVCSQACIQGSASLSRPVPLGSSKASKDAPLLRAALASLPEPAKGWTLTATRGKGAVTLVATPPKGAAPKVPIEFFPLEGGIVDHARPFVATLRGDRFVFKMDASPYPESHDRLKGLLVLTGVGRHALLIGPKIRNGD